MTKVERALHLAPNESIRAAWCERASGPGWSNRIVWVLVQSPTRIRVECLQPDEQTEDMRLLFDVAEAAHTGLRGAVARAART